MIINIYKSGMKRCYLNDIWHNDYGPDYNISNGYKSYYINGNCHNIYGPAIIYYDGEKQYWLNSIYCTKEEWEVKRHDY